eukprot:3612966-Ditylum_brightwellii.AAC.1
MNLLKICQNKQCKKKQSSKHKAGKAKDNSRKNKDKEKSLSTPFKMEKKQCNLNKLKALGLTSLINDIKKTTVNELLESSTSTNIANSDNEYVELDSDEEQLPPKNVTEKYNKEKENKKYEQSGLDEDTNGDNVQYV